MLFCLFFFFYRLILFPPSAFSSNSASFNLHHFLRPRRPSPCFLFSWKSSSYHLMLTRRPSCFFPVMSNAKRDVLVEVSAHTWSGRWQTQPQLWRPLLSFEASDGWRGMSAPPTLRHPHKQMQSAGRAFITYKFSYKHQNRSHHLLKTTSEQRSRSLRESS